MIKSEKLFIDWTLGEQFLGLDHGSLWMTTDLTKHDRATLGSMPAPTPIPPELLRRPFHLDEARRLGLSLQTLRGRRFRRLFRSVYVSAAVPVTLELMVRAARLALPESAVFSHETAAVLRNLPVPADDRLHVTMPAGSAHPEIRGIVVHKALMGDAATFRGVPVTTAERTFTDLARTLPLVEAVVLGDAMVRRGFTTPEHWRVPQRNARAAARTPRGRRPAWPDAVSTLRWRPG